MTASLARLNDTHFNMVNELARELVELQGLRLQLREIEETSKEKLYKDLEHAESPKVTIAPDLAKLRDSMFDDLNLDTCSFITKECDEDIEVEPPKLSSTEVSEQKDSLLTRAKQEWNKVYNGALNCIRKMKI